MAPSSEGDRTVDCSTYVRTDLIMHRVLTRQSPLRMRIEASARALVVTVLRGRSAATPALDNGGLLIEDEAAEEAGLPGVIAHGMLTAATMGLPFSSYLEHGYVK